MDLNYTLINGYEQKQNPDVVKLRNGAVLSLDKNFNENRIEIPKWVKGNVILPKTVIDFTYNSEIMSIDDINANIDSITYLNPNAYLVQAQEEITTKQKCYPFTLEHNGVAIQDNIEILDKGIIINVSVNDVEINDEYIQSTISIGTSESPYFVFSEEEQCRFDNQQFITLSNFSQTQLNSSFSESVEQEHKPYTMSLQLTSPSSNQTIRFDITDYQFVDAENRKCKIEYSGLNNLLPVINETFPNYKFDYLGFRFWISDYANSFMAGMVVCDVLEPNVSSTVDSVVAY